LNDAACPAGAVVFYTLVGAADRAAGRIRGPELRPEDGEWVYRPGPDKFLGSPLEQRLKDRGIKTVIGTGSCAQRVVIDLVTLTRSDMIKF
jgi:hypothetical protein